MTRAGLEKVAGVTCGCALGLLWFGGWALLAPFAVAWQMLREK